jgi:hypothetical protein
MDALHDTKIEQNTQAFLSELSDLCRKHRLGITGHAELFMMEPDDAALHYVVDGESRLHFA